MSIATDNTNDNTSAQRMANQMPSTPNRAGRMNTAAVSNTRVRTVEMIAETLPLFKAVKNEEA